MSNSSIVLPSLSFSFSPLSLGRRARRLQLQASSFLPSPKPRTKRPNRLRPKLPKTLNPKPQSPPPPPPDESLVAHPIVVKQEVEAVEGAVLVAEGVDPFPPPDLRWFPGPVLDLAFRFAALLALQTVVTVWFLSAESVEESRERGEQGKKSREVEKEEVDFERKVLEIREMAKEAKESERKDLAGGNRVKEEVGRGLGRLRKSFAQVILDENSSSSSPSSSSKNRDEIRSRRKLNEKGKLGFLSSNTKSRNVPKGFSGLKSKEKSIDGGSGM